MQNRTEASGSHHHTRRVGVLLTAAIALLVVGCASTASTGKQTKAGSSKGSASKGSAQKGATERGIASWYGEPYHGRRTANGEVYDMNGISAAHKTLPFETRVRVDNLDNGQSMVVRINDRGPFIKGRIIDLSLGAARQIDMVNAGVAKVKLTIVETPPSSDPVKGSSSRSDVPTDFSSNRYLIQVGAFLERANAEALAKQLERNYSGVVIQSDDRWHRVQIGDVKSSDKASRLLDDLRRDGYDAIIIKR